MKTLINLIWQGENLVRTIPLSVGEKGAELLLAKSKGQQFPDYIEEEDASKYNLDVKVEDVKPKMTKKAVNVAPKESSNARPKILSKEEIESSSKETVSEETE